MVIWPVNGVAYVFVDPGTHDRNGFLVCIFCLFLHNMKFTG